MRRETEKVRHSRKEDLALRMEKAIFLQERGVFEREKAKELDENRRFFLEWVFPYRCCLQTWIVMVMLMRIEEG